MAIQAEKEVMQRVPGQGLAVRTAAIEGEVVTTARMSSIKWYLNSNQEEVTKTTVVLTGSELADALVCRYLTGRSRASKGTDEIYDGPGYVSTI